jgi:ribosome-associated protein
VLQISPTIAIPDEELDIAAIRAQGAGGQNVNKVASAVHLRFDVRGSASLPEACKQRLLSSHDRRITGDGVIVIKSQRFRSQEKNRADALERLRDLVRSALAAPKPRRPTKPTRASREKRLEDKTRRSRLKQQRRDFDS